MASLGDSVLRAINDTVKAAMASEPLRSRPKQVAQQSVSRLQRAGRAGKVYRHFVNGIVDGDENAVGFVDGSLVYQFSLYEAAVRYVHSYLVENSPIGTRANKRGGRFREAWVVFVDHQLWLNKKFSDIPAGATIHITNYAPYASHVEAGWGHRDIKAYHLVRNAVKDARRHFPALRFSEDRIHIPKMGGSAQGWQVPYIRRTNIRPKAGKLAQEGAGSEIAYPAVKIEA